MEVTTCLSSSSSAKLGCLYDFPQSQTNSPSYFLRFPRKSRAVSSTSVSNGHVGPESLTQSQTNTIRSYTKSGSCLIRPARSPGQSSSFSAVPSSELFLRSPTAT